jgi:hypothetical protein
MKKKKLSAKCTNEEQINVILNKFDFDKTREIFDFLLNFKMNIMWPCSDLVDLGHTPTVEQLKKRAWNLLHIVSERGISPVNGDGFIASYDNETGCLSLKFVIEEVDAAELIDWDEE